MRLHPAPAGAGSMGVSPGPDPADLPDAWLAARQQVAAPGAPSATADAGTATLGSVSARAGSARDDGGFLPGADDESPSTSERVGALDGIRALAVFLVLFFHVGMPGFAGGYLGVDVFFVLSGFLITTLLLRDIVAHGRIDLARFWARRMARLMPAAMLLFLVVGLWSLTAAPAFRRAGLGADALWCLFYVGNWHFIASSSYFVYDGTTSPLVHLWSLGVEEQFYVVWPLVLQAVALLLAGVSAGRHALRDLPGARRRSTTAVMITGGALAAASIWWMTQTYLAAGPDRAYMGTDTKVFEPLLGAVFAAATLRPRVGAWVRDHAQELMVAGLGGLLLGVTLLGTPHGAHPAYFLGGAVAVCAAAVALVAGASKVETAEGLGRLFASEGLTYLGRISYGIYLWHWPWALWLLPESRFDPGSALLVAAMTVATASASYHLVELPLRTGRFRLARPARILRTGAAGMACTAVVPVLLGASPWYAGWGGTVGVDHPGPIGHARVMLVGDSVPLQLYGAFAQAGEHRGVVLINGAHGGCSASGVVTVNPDGSPYNPLIPRMPGAPDGPICAGVPSDQKALLEQEKPTIVLWWSRYEMGDLLGPDGRPVRAGDPSYRRLQQEALDAAVDRLSAGGAMVVAVDPEPTGAKTAEGCRPDRRSEPAGECAAFLMRLRFDDEVRRGWESLLRAKAETDRRLRLVRVADLFCRTDTNPCDDRLPLAENGVFGPPTSDPARVDGSHFAPEVRARIAGQVLSRALDVAARQGP